jgi:hypothetical protein
VSSIVSYLGACDASAAVRLGGTAWFVAACDEDYILRVYDRSAPGPPAASVELVDFLKPEDPEHEPDIEGAALVGERIYWVTSHGRDGDGDEQESRQRLFATSVSATARGVRIAPVGRPYTRLLKDLVRAPALEPFELRRAAQRSPQEPGGLNLEGLAPAPGGSLLLGFRNPIPEGRALVVALGNADDLVEDRASTARLRVAGRLDLGGRGIRAIEYVPESKIYLIVAGAFDDARDFRLYAWPGGLHDAAVGLDVDLDDCKPEELIVTEVRGRRVHVELLSDDGGRKAGGKKCKKADPEMRSFRGLRTVVEI